MHLLQLPAGLSASVISRRKFVSLSRHRGGVPEGLLFSSYRFLFGSPSYHQFVARGGVFINDAEQTQYRRKDAQARLQHNLGGASPQTRSLSSSRMTRRWRQRQAYAFTKVNWRARRKITSRQIADGYNFCCDMIQHIIGIFSNHKPGSNRPRNYGAEPCEDVHNQTLKMVS